MSKVAKASLRQSRVAALEKDFPFIEISRLAEHESWRKEIYRPITHIHKWWAVRLGSVFRALVLGSLLSSEEDIWACFYKDLNFRDKVVLDPFMGSGTTLVEALKLGAKAVGCDINPVSTFIVRQALTPVDPKALWDAYYHLESTVGSEIRRYYITIDPATGEQIPVLYFFWVKEVISPEGERIPLFSKYVFAQHAYPKQHPESKIVCPSCWGVFSDKYNTTQADCPHCGYRFNPQDGPAKGAYVRDSKGQLYRIRDLLPEGHPPHHRLYAMLSIRPDGRRVYLPVSDFDRALYQDAVIRLCHERLPLPQLPVRPGHNTDQARRYNYLTWRSFFNERQLLTLGLLLREILQIENEVVRNHMILLFSSILEYNNMFCSYKGEGTGAVRPIFAHHILKPERTPLENSVWGWPESSGTFSTLFTSRLLKAKAYLRRPIELRVEKGKAYKVFSKPVCPQLVKSWESLQSTTGGVLVLNGDSAHLPLPDNSVDAVITDPPYFDFVHYSELSDFFFAWLAPILREQEPFFSGESSGRAGEVQRKDPREFAKMLGRVLAESARVLKPGGVVVFTFHHSRPEGWGAVSKAIVDGGLVVVAAYPVHGELKVSTAKSTTSEPISLDAVLVCKKRCALEMPPHEEQIKARAEEYIERLKAEGMKLSASDLFVVRASQALLISTAVGMDLDDAIVYFTQMRS